jgi:hypothetical protein
MFKNGIGSKEYVESERREARMLANAQQKILNSTQWLTADQLSKRMTPTGQNPSTRLTEWLSKGLIFFIRNDRTELFPLYALNPSAGYEPAKELAEIIEVFRERKDGWGLAYWFGSANGFLGGRRPQDILHTHSEAVLAAAKDEVRGVSHG